MYYRSTFIDLIIIILIITLIVFFDFLFFRISFFLLLPFLVNKRCIYNSVISCNYYNTDLIYDSSNFRMNANPFPTLL